MNFRRSLPSLVSAAMLALAFAIPAHADAQTRSHAAPSKAPTKVAATPDTATHAATTTAPLFASAHGIAVDSIHDDQPLEGAVVQLDNGARKVTTNQYGEFLIDSIPPGTHVISLHHPMLDTIGVAVTTAPAQFAAGENHVIDLAVPSGETLAASLCPPARRALGPAVVVGFVRIADTDAPAVGARVSLLWYEIDQAAKKVPRVREATVGDDGRFRLCGVPVDMSGRLQVINGKVTSGDIPVEQGNAMISLRALSVADPNGVIAQTSTPATTNTSTSSTSTVATSSAPNDTMKPSMSATTTTMATRGGARLTGRVTSRNGMPLGNARVDLAGSGQAATTRTDGSFTLDNLPVGTQSLEVRRLGYAPTAVAVELSSRTPATVTVQMDEHIPTLETVRVQAAQDKALSDVGYLQRKKTGMGYYLDGAQVERRQAIRTSELLRQVPSLRVETGPDGSLMVESARNPMNGCVQFWVDGTPWTQMNPGDLDQFVQPQEIAAIEVYNPATTPVQFQNGSSASCTTIVFWTNRNIKKDK